MIVAASQVAAMRAQLADTMADTVAVETYAGEAAVGATYGTSTNVTCNAMSTRRLVRNASGDEVVSELTLHVKSTDEAKFTPESRVTLSTRVSKVITTSPKTFRGQTVIAEVACE